MVGLNARARLEALYPLKRLVDLHILHEAFEPFDRLEGEVVAPESGGEDGGAVGGHTGEGLWSRREVSVGEERGRE